MGIEGRRARSHTHGRRHGRTTVHAVVVTLALLAVAVASYYPRSSNAVAPAELPGFVVSGIAATGESQSLSFLRPPSHLETRPSIALAGVTPVADVRTVGSISSGSSFSSGVSAAVAASGEAGAGVKPLVDIVDPNQPFVLYVTGAGDSVSGVAQKYGIAVETLLDNNKEISDSNLIQYGQQLVVPREDGILHKVSFGETVGDIVAQYDNISVETVVSYRPNAVADASSLESGKTLLLIGATPKPPPPPPPVIVAPSPGGGGGGGTAGTPPPASGGRFSLPLSAWLRVSDDFGTYRGVGRIHEGIDLDLWGFWNSPIYSACDGTVIKTEYLTYSYGYHVVVDCGDGWTTLYAHMSEISVAPGQRVGTGALLGFSGVTGYTTGEHLHFEIRYFGAPVNPAHYLPF